MHDVYGPIGVPPAVFEEVVVKGKKRGFDDALIAEAAMEKGFLAKTSLSREAFFRNPREERTKLFLSQILTH